MHTPLTITFDASRASAAVTKMLQYIRDHDQQDIIQQRGSLVQITIEDHSDSDDLFQITIEDPLTWSERARINGVMGLEEKDSIPGKFSSAGYLFPTEAYIAKVEKTFGDNLPGSDTLTFSVPHQVITQVRFGMISHINAVEAIAQDFQSFMDKLQRDTTESSEMGRPPIYGEPMTKATFMVERSMREWLRTQPDGMAGAIRRIIRAEMDRENGAAS